MPPESPRPDPTAEARSTLDALGRLRGRSDAPSAEELRRRAQALLEARFGAATQRHGAAADGFGRGAVGLPAGHTHYSDGFAVLAPLDRGAAVALRRAPASEAPFRLAFEETADEASDAQRELDDAPPREARAAQAVVEAFLSAAAAAAVPPVEAALVSAVPPACFDARLAALGVAAARAAIALAKGGESAPPQPAGEGEHDDAVERVRAALAEGAGVPVGRAPVQAAAYDAPPNASSPRWLLADTTARERLAFEAPDRDALSCGLVMLGDSGETRADPETRLNDGTLVQPPAFHHRRRRQADRALRVLREDDDAFAGLTAFRDLEHRDLDRAEHLLPPALGPVARHLITENRRTGKLVRAARRGDGQLLGALLLMSHTSLQEDWQSTAAPQDALASAAEDAGIDGLYGARATGRGPAVLIAGRAAALPRFFRHATRLLADRFDRPAETMLL